MILLALTLITGAVVLANMNKAGEEISITITRFGKTEIKDGAVKVMADLAIDNPTNTLLRIKKPNIKVFYNGVEVGNSIPSSEMFKIQANGRTDIKGLNIQVPLSNLPSALISLITSQNLNMNLKAVATTQVNGINYSTEKELTI